VGFTETDRAGRLYNAAAVFHRGEVLAVYRKLHPAIRSSVYMAGDGMPVFTIGGLTFGIVICRDSTFSGPAAAMAAAGATVLFVPTNNALPPEKVGPWIVTEAREADVARATETAMQVVRADVAGRTAGLVAYGSSAVVAPDGSVLRAAQPFAEDLIVAEVC
jgi:predicted amidohydrolase